LERLAIEKFATGEPHDLRMAISLWNQAIKVYRQDGHPLAAVRLLDRIAQTLWELEETDSALAYFSSEEEEARALRDLPFLVGALHAQAVLHALSKVEGQEDSAWAEFTEALELARPPSTLGPQIQVSVCVAKLHLGNRTNLFAEHHPEVLKCLKNASSDARLVGDRVAEAVARFVMGFVEPAWRRSVQDLGDALQLGDAIDANVLVGPALGGIAGVYRAHGQVDSAYFYSVQLALHQSRLDSVYFDSVLNADTVQVGHLSFALRHTQARITDWRRFWAVDLLRTTSSSLSTSGWDFDYDAVMDGFLGAADLPVTTRPVAAYLSMGKMLAEGGGWERGLQFQQAALLTAKRSKDPRGQIIALLDLSATYGRHDRPSQARSAIRDALEAATGQDTAFQARALLSAGRECMALGDYREALENFHNALKLFRSEGSSAGQGAALEYIGAVHLEQLRPDSGWIYFRRALRFLGSSDRPGYGSFKDIESELGHQETSVRGDPKDLSRRFRDRLADLGWPMGSEHGSDYVITSFVAEPPLLTTKWRGRRTSYLIEFVAEDSVSGCTTVAVSWLVVSKGTNDREWRRVGNDTSYLPQHHMLITPLLKEHCS
jgi:tetratricopeptide (TPR) repeat protein